MKRIKLADRQLPDYTVGEEIMNMVTHIVGGALGVMVLLMCLSRGFYRGTGLCVFGCAVYGISIITLYTMSSIYHGLRPGMAKKVLQVLDHCTIYFLIAGTYTPILLSAFVPAYPWIGWGLFAAEWALAALAGTLTAIDLKKYTVFSMICYIGMGWGIIFFLPQAIELMTKPGFYWLLAGGIAYTVGAIFYGIGAKKRWIHCVFHIFVVIGSLLQFVAIYGYAL